MSRNTATHTAAALTATLAVGCALLAVGHSGVELGLLSRLGPGGSRAVVPAAIAFAVATVALCAVAVGLWRRRSWAWGAGVVLHGLILIAAAVPFRGAGSFAGMVLAAGAAGVLVSRAGRAALLGPDEHAT